jgi:hypothetical protein
MRSKGCTVKNPDDAASERHCNSKVNHARRSKKTPTIIPGSIDVNMPSTIWSRMHLCSSPSYLSNLSLVKLLPSESPWKHMSDSYPREGAKDAGACGTTLVYTQPRNLASLPTSLLSKGSPGNSSFDLGTFQLVFTRRSLSVKGSNLGMR